MRRRSDTAAPSRAAIDNTVILPGHTRIDAAVYVPISEKWKVQANIENVLNLAPTT